MELTKEQALELAQTNTLELDNGQTLRFRMSPDDLSINDWDCYGTIEHIGRNGRSERPHNFDGMAEKIWGYNEQYWWQPPDDIRSQWHDKEIRKQFRETVKNILAFGFDCYWIELCEGSNAYGEPIVVDYAVCGGFEPLQNDEHIADSIMEIAYQLDVQLVKKG